MERTRRSDPGRVPRRPRPFTQPLRATGAHCRAAAARPVPERLRASTEIRKYPACDRIAQWLMTL
jgi:hypothetical protein